jgi:hypothetical protein
MLCNFPAKELLAYRRELSAAANNLIPDGQTLRDVMHCVMAIDRLRMAHEDIVGCHCWQEAIAKSALVAV